MNVEPNVSLGEELNSDFNPLEEAASAVASAYGAKKDNNDFENIGDQEPDENSGYGQEEDSGLFDSPEAEGEYPEGDGEDPEGEGEADSDSPPEDEEEEEYDSSYDNIRIARSFSKIAKRDAALRRKEAALKEREKQLEKLAELAQELESDPAAVIQKLGLDADKLYMSDVERKAQQEASRIEALERRIEDLQNGIREREERMEVQRKGERWEMDFEAEFSESEFSAVRSWDPSGQIVRKMVADRYQRTGKLMSPRRALQILSNEIEDRISRFPGRSSQEEEEPRARPRRRRKTLSSEAPANVAHTVSASLDDEADMERITAKYMALMKTNSRR